MQNWSIPEQMWELIDLPNAASTSLTRTVSTPVRNSANEVSVVPTGWNGTLKIGGRYLVPIVSRAVYDKNYGDPHVNLHFAHLLQVQLSRCCGWRLLVSKDT